MSPVKPHYVQKGQIVSTAGVIQTSGPVVSFLFSFLQGSSRFFKNNLTKYIVVCFKGLFFKLLFFHLPVHHDTTKEHTGSVHGPHTQRLAVNCFIISRWMSSIYLLPMFFVLRIIFRVIVFFFFSQYVTTPQRNIQGQSVVRTLKHSQLIASLFQGVHLFCLKDYILSSYIFFLAVGNDPTEEHTGPVHDPYTQS